MNSKCYTSPIHFLIVRFDTAVICTEHTSDSEREVSTSFLSCSYHLTGVCPSITCGSCVDSQDVSIVDLSTIVPFYFTWSIWTGPGVAEWCSIR